MEWASRPAMGRKRRFDGRDARPTLLSIRGALAAAFAFLRRVVDISQ